MATAIQSEQRPLVLRAPAMLAIEWRPGLKCIDRRYNQVCKIFCCVLFLLQIKKFRLQRPLDRYLDPMYEALDLKTSITRLPETDLERVVLALERAKDVRNPDVKASQLKQLIGKPEQYSYLTRAAHLTFLAVGSGLSCPGVIRSNDSGSSAGNPS